MFLSLPKLINLNEKPKSEDGKAMIPLEKYDAQCMSMGFYIDEKTPHDLERPYHQCFENE